MDGPMPASSYTVTRCSGCIIVRGEIPLTDMPALAQLGPAGAIVDGLLAEHLQANLVFGLPEDCRTLRAAAGLSDSRARQGMEK